MSSERDLHHESCGEGHSRRGELLAARGKEEGVGVEGRPRVVIRGREDT